MILPSVLFQETYRHALIQRIRQFSLMTQEPVNDQNWLSGIFLFKKYF